MSFLHFDTVLDAPRIALLVAALAIALGFEFVNGFHDTANAVATVIYTNSLKPQVAVVWSGICNFFGVWVGGIAVALSIMKLLPVELLVSGGTGAALAMVFALLAAAILWNLGTWWFGLPSSSSHTLIGSILGVGIAHAMITGRAVGSSVNWGKARDIGLSLVVSPMFGLAVAGGLLLLAQRFLKNRALHEAPKNGEKPPTWVRAILIGTCSGVSFAHGSNDGQKGIGLVLLILIGILPADYALNHHATTQDIRTTVTAVAELETMTKAKFGDDTKLASNSNVVTPPSPASKALTELANVQKLVAGKNSVSEIRPEDRFEVRKAVLSADAALGDLEKKGSFSKEEKAALTKKRAALRGLTDYAPAWA